MADKKTDGGPAFPVSQEESRGKVAGIYGGMTLRDYFAVKAMHALFSNPTVKSINKKTGEFVVEPDKKAPSIAKDAYLIADAMLAEREK